MTTDTDRRVLVIRDADTGNFAAQELPPAPRDVDLLERIVSVVESRPTRIWSVVVVPSSVSSRDVTRYAEERTKIG